jgi:hypothetical protein
MSIILLVCAADGLVALFAHKPFPWVVIIPSTIPFLVAAFVIIPLIRAEKS